MKGISPLILIDVLWIGLVASACTSQSIPSLYQPAISQAGQALTSLPPSPIVTTIVTSTLTPTLLPDPPTPAPTDTSTPVPTATPTPTELACWQAGGRVETGRFPSDLLDKPMDFRVYLPPCYDQQPERRYPVLYLLHGQNSTDEQWDRMGIDEAADRLVAQGELPPFLIVMPQDPEQFRTDEDPFNRVLIEEFIPWIDHQYHTLADREFRAIGGLSRGGGWSIHFALSHPELFGILGGHSPAIFWTDVSKIKKWLNAIPAESMPRIFLDIGNNDNPQIAEAARWFEDLLTQRGITHEWYTFVGVHAESLWSAHIDQYLRWYAASW